jgi:hypothetical protein
MSLTESGSSDAIGPQRPSFLRNVRSPTTSQDGIYVNFALMSSVICRIASIPAVAALAQSIKLLWVLPVSVCALPILPLAVWRARWQVRTGVLEISSPALAWFLRGPWFRAMSGGEGFAAATIGHVIVARDGIAMDRCRLHEHAHVRQCERWGVFFPLVYMTAGLYAAFRARRWSAYYWNNRFEREARAAEGNHS